MKTWAEALNELGDESDPAYVIRLGRVDARGITPGTKDAERSIRYVTKYVTKDLTEHADPRSDAQRAHFDRLHHELSTLPCSPTCANWLLYGVQPDKAKKGLIPGRCSGKVHQRHSLGFTGRRVLVSRQWSGKTLATTEATNAPGYAPSYPEPSPTTSNQTTTTGTPTSSPVPTNPTCHRYRPASCTPIAVRQRQKAALRHALEPPGSVPATQINYKAAGKER